MTRGIVLAVTLFAAATSAGADTRLAPTALANRALADPGQEAEAKTLMGELRCLVCQGQSIADSDADLAGDMRALVRERIQVGETPEKVRGWLVARYGDYVSYDPPFDAFTAPLWLAPLLLLGLGVAIARGSFKRRRARG